MFTIIEIHRAHVSGRAKSQRGGSTVSHQAGQLHRKLRWPSLLACVNSEQELVTTWWCGLTTLPPSYNISVSSSSTRTTWWISSADFTITSVYCWLYEVSGRQKCVHHQVSSHSRLAHPTYVYNIRYQTSVYSWLFDVSVRQSCFHRQVSSLILLNTYVEPFPHSSIVLSVVRVVNPNWTWVESEQCWTIIDWR